jgi:hypothetical protein
MAMLGAECSPCCEKPEPECDCLGTVGTAPAIASDAARGLVYVTATGDCFGTGAEGKADAPQPLTPCDYDSANGPIESISLLSGGSGYAKVGRVAPTITATAGGTGSGATLSVTLTKTEVGDCLVPHWSVSAVTVTNPGSGYADDTEVTLSAAAGDTVETAGFASAFVAIDEPVATVTVSTTNGAGAVLAVDWGLLSSGDWYTTARGSPCQGPPKKTYAVSDILITNGGSGYEQFDLIDLTFASAADGGALLPLIADVDAVDGNGAITAIFITDPGKFIGSLTDELDEVVTHTATGACGQPTGKYYREDKTVAPYVSPVTVTIEQESPSTGGGAEVSATVDDDPDSATFGQVTGFTVDDGGNSYMQIADCGVPQSVYVTVGTETLEVPMTGELVVSNAVCGPEDPVFDATFSRAFFEAFVSGCKCTGKVHVQVNRILRCYETLPEEYEVQRINFSTTQAFCYQFEDDCLDNDPVLIQTGPAVPALWQANNIPFDVANGCVGYEGYWFPGLPPLFEGECPCNLDCDGLAITVSLMP